MLLPSTAYGYKRCSQKHKIRPKEKFCNHYLPCRAVWAGGGSPASWDKQFITVVSKTSNYFYIIIGRDWDGQNAVHFLNPMDEADLLTLMEVEEKPPTLSAPTT